MVGKREREREKKRVMLLKKRGMEERIKEASKKRERDDRRKIPACT